MGIFLNAQLRAAASYEVACARDVAMISRRVYKLGGAVWDVCV